MKKTLDSNKFRLYSNDFDINTHLTVSKKIVSGKIQKHWHSYFEAEIILSGEAKTEINGVRYQIKKGSVYLLTPKDFHSLEIIEPLTLYNISFDNKLLPLELTNELLSRDFSFFNFQSKEFDDLTGFADVLYGEYSNDDKYKTDAINSLLEYFIILILRKLPCVKLRAATDAVSKAISYLNFKFRETPSLRQAAKEVNLNPTYFSELFKRETGVSYTNYLTALKIDYAKSLLKNDDVKITDVAYESGFNSLSNFMRAFKQREGLSPKNYRGKKLKTTE